MNIVSLLTRSQTLYMYFKWEAVYKTPTLEIILPMIFFICTILTFYVIIYRCFFQSHMTYSFLHKTKYFGHWFKLSVLFKFTSDISTSIHQGHSLFCHLFVQNLSYLFITFWFIENIVKKTEENSSKLLLKIHLWKTDSSEKL